MVDVDVRNPGDPGRVFGKRFALPLEPALGRLGSGKAEIQRVEQALGCDRIERERGIADRQPILSCGRFEPASLRRAITSFALIPTGFQQKAPDHRQRARPCQQCRQRAPVACGGQIGVGVERQNARTLR